MTFFFEDRVKHFFSRDSSTSFLILLINTLEGENPQKERKKKKKGIFSAFEILLNFLRSGSRKIPPNTNVCTESIGYAAEYLGKIYGY